MDEQTKQAARQWTIAQPIVSAFVATVVRDFSARDDVLQDIAVAVIESYGRYDPQRPFLGWALGIARNQVGLYLRRMRRDRLVFSDEIVDCLALAFEKAAPESLRSLEHLNECLAGLEDRARQICHLRYVEDLRPSAIAPVVGMKANAVAKALERIRSQLRDCLQRKMQVEGRAI